MPNDASVTVRIPAALKRRVEGRAREAHRSLSAQVLHDLEASAAAAVARPARGRFLGLFAGTPVPTDAHIQEVRARLWGRLTELAPSGAEGLAPRRVEGSHDD